MTAKRVKKAVVFDTNTLLSSILRAGSVSEQAFIKAINHDELYFSDETWQELVEVIHRPKFAKYFQPHQVTYLLETLARIGIFAKVTQAVVACRDPKDDKFLSLAIAVQATIIVSGDKDLLVLHPFRGIDILTAAEFLTVM
ncbi:MAG: putative toxin-antitoxin system toxin component, PIN family [Moraxellaceae bacterium]|nr:MAG: putative toxin-antitoxin system toxin component, PIN family [Moraxellaceae bacterium]